MSLPKHKTALIDLQYLPSIEYFTVLAKYDNILFEVEENFVKQTYLNRCHILTANKIDSLIIPIVGGNKKTKIKDVTIDYNQRWQKNHWRAIQSAYGKAPFFEHFAEYFLPFYESPEKYLVDYNLKLLTNCLKLLQQKIAYSLTKSYFQVNETDQIDDFRSVVHPKRDYKSNNLLLPVNYPQVFGNNFAVNMSIIDLLFCEGPNAKSIVTKSIKLE